MNPVEFGSYAQMLCEPAYADWKAPQFAEALGVSTTTIYRWDKKVDWDSIKAERRKRFARPTMDVDLALLKAAKQMDVQAIRTWYERFDQWLPSSKVVNEHSVSDAEVDQALNDLIERKRNAASALNNSAVDGDGRAAPTPTSGGEVKAEAGRTAEVLSAQSGPAEIH